jgi:hypothetical protein
MRWLRCCVLLACLAVPSFTSGQKEDWLPITAQDLQFKDVPGIPGASAVRLYYAHYVDDNTTSEFVYERIKILNDKGKKHGDVEIPILTFSGIFVAVNDLKARTIRPDGSIVDFNGKTFEKTVYKGRGNKFAAVTFTLPEVSVGSIVEYKYKYSFRSAWYSGFFVFSNDEWNLQSDLYTVKENLHFRPYEGGVYQSLSQPSFYWDGAQISWVTSNLKEKPKNKGNELELDVQNVPAFESEDYMPPENNYKQSVVFFYSRKGIDTTAKAWQEIGKGQYATVESFLAKDRGIKEGAVRAIGGETDPGAKLRKLYAKAQEIRNLTYERERTMEERKKENIQRNLGAGDVLSHGYGTDKEITYLFVALARAAGFNASVVQISDRKERFFSKEWTSLRQLDTPIAVVSVNGADVYLEPGTRFCPFGYLRWNHTATDGLRLDKNGGTFVKAPPSDYDKSVVRRATEVTLSEDGTLKGYVIVEFRGSDALEHRLAAIESDEAGKKKDLEDELVQGLPAGALVKMTEAKGWDSTEEPLLARFSIEVPSYASTAGKLLVIPSCLFQVKKIQAFKHAQRKYPVYFPYAFLEMDHVSLKIPAGFAVETLPQQQEASLKYAKYQSVTKYNNSELVTERRLAFNGVYFELEKFPELKTFFGKVQSGDEQQAVFHGGNASAQTIR